MLNLVLWSLGFVLCGELKDRWSLLMLVVVFIYSSLLNLMIMKKRCLGGPWFILDHYLMISTWKPNFRPSKNGFDNMYVWIRIDELPIEYYDKEVLFAIEKVVGKPIRVDYATDKVTRGRYARVCVDIYLSKPLITKIWVGGAWQAIQYENISSLCFACGRIGHLQ